MFFSKNIIGSPEFGRYSIAIG